MASQLFPTLLVLQGTRVTDDAPDQPVVVRVRGGAETFGKTRVKLVFKWQLRRAIRDVQPQPPETRGGDEDEQRALRLPALQQIGQPGGDEFLAGQ